MAVAGIYSGGPLYQDPQAIDDLKHSGFTTVVAWSVHVASNGDLAINDTPLVTNAAYSGPEGWPAKLAKLKNGGSVNRLIFSVGADGTTSRDFTHIRALIAEHGTTSGPLVDSFRALKAAIPGIDAIDFDDEDLVEEDVIVSFGELITGLGWQVTFCPYFDPQLWAKCLARLEARSPGSVAGFNLQCYDGGGDNEPSDWIAAIAAEMGPDFDAAGFVSPGLWCRHGQDCGEGRCPQEFTAQLSAWRETSAIASGWLWLYDHVLACAGSNVCSSAMGTSAYADAILAAFPAPVSR